jgi:RNA polymerase sigma-70 factor, ECF subfamily
VSQKPQSSNGLLDQIRSGDVAALAGAFEEYRERLSRIVHFRLDSRVAQRLDPGDVLQESYLNAYKRCGYLEGTSEESLFVWIRLIVLQTLDDVHRRHLGAQMRDAGRDRGSANLSSSDNTSLSMAAVLAARFVSPSGAMRHKELSDQLQLSLNQMNESDREVLALRHFEELSNQEIAAVLGIDQKAASIRYIRALRKFKDLLADTPGFDFSHAGMGSR